MTSERTGHRTRRSRTLSSPRTLAKINGGKSGKKTLGMQTKTTLERTAAQTLREPLTRKTTSMTGITGEMIGDWLEQVADHRATMALVTFASARLQTQLLLTVIGRS